MSGWYGPGQGRSEREAWTKALHYGKIPSNRRTLHATDPKSLTSELAGYLMRSQLGFFRYMAAVAA